MMNHRFPKNCSIGSTTLWVSAANAGPSGLNDPALGSPTGINLVTAGTTVQRLYAFSDGGIARYSNSRHPMIAIRVPVRFELLL